MKLKNMNRALGIALLVLSVASISPVLADVNLQEVRIRQADFTGSLATTRG